MFPHNGSGAHPSFESSASKRLKLGESSYSAASPRKSSADDERDTLGPRITNFQDVEANFLGVRPRTSPEYTGASQNQDSSCSGGDGGGKDVHRSQFRHLPEDAALGVGDTLLRTLNVSASPSPSLGRTSNHLNDTRSESHRSRQLKQPGLGRINDESLLAPVKAFLSSPSSSDKTAKPEDIIDLTQDDDDDVVFTGFRKRAAVQTSPKVEVCYGTVKAGTINSYRVPDFPPNSSQFPMLLRITRAENPQSLMIHAYDCNNQPFGHVDVNTAKALAPLMDLGVFRIQVFLYPLQTYALSRTSVLKSYPFFFTVYGPEEEGKKAATLISQKNVFFEKPHHGYHDEIPYRNPHHNMPQHLPHSSKPRPQNSLSFVFRTAEEIRSDVNTVFDGLDQAENLPEMEPSSGIKTPLLKHQKQGLYFLTSKERERTYDENENQNMSLWRKKDKHGKAYYYHVITGQQVNRRPPDVLGGILADMMGLGKVCPSFARQDVGNYFADHSQTLQILSLVITTQENSLIFSKSPKPRHHTAQDHEPLSPTMNAKTTLLISPLSTIGNWEEQIQAHVQEGALTYHLYHGSKREADPKVLAEFDLVITTYQVIASEWSKHLKDRDSFFSPLQQIKFFRIVLDG
jgi:hypothetical protein